MYEDNVCMLRFGIWAGMSEYSFSFADEDQHCLVGRPAGDWTSTQVCITRHYPYFHPINYSFIVYNIP